MYMLEMQWISYNRGYLRTVKIINIQSMIAEDLCIFFNKNNDRVTVESWSIDALKTI